MTIHLSRDDTNAALFLQSWGKGPGSFKRGKFPKLGKKSHNEQSLGNKKKHKGNCKFFLFFLHFQFWEIFQKLGENIYYLDRGMGPKYGPKFAIKKGLA